MSSSYYSKIPLKDHLAEKMHFSFLAIAIAIALTASMSVSAWQDCADGDNPCVTDWDCTCPDQICIVSIVLQTRPVTHRVIRAASVACFRDRTPAGAVID
jgi:hypothetical protein